MQSVIKNGTKNIRQEKSNLSPLWPYFNFRIITKLCHTSILNLVYLKLQSSLNRQHGQAPVKKKEQDKFWGYYRFEIRRWGPERFYQQLQTEQTGLEEFTHKCWGPTPPYTHISGSSPIDGGYKSSESTRSQNFAPHAIWERSSLRVSTSSCEELLQATHPANCPLASLHDEQYQVHRESKGLGMRERAIGDSATHFIRSPYWSKNF